MINSYCMKFTKSRIIKFLMCLKYEKIFSLNVACYMVHS